MPWAKIRNLKSKIENELSRGSPKMAEPRGGY